ncbi:hypothetical protein M8C21_030941, partial [Ambrosia artemisiifolia]
MTVPKPPETEGNIAPLFLSRVQSIKREREDKEMIETIQIVKKRVPSKCKYSMLNISIDEYTSEERNEKFKLGEALMEVVTFMDPRKKIRTQHGLHNPTFTLIPLLHLHYPQPPSLAATVRRHLHHSSHSSPPSTLTTDIRRRDSLSTVSPPLHPAALLKSVAAPNTNPRPPPVTTSVTANQPPTATPHHLPDPLLSRKDAYKKNRARPFRHLIHLHHLSSRLPPSSPSIEDNALFKLGE